MFNLTTPLVLDKKSARSSAEFPTLTLSHGVRNRPEALAAFNRYSCPPSSESAINDHNIRKLDQLLPWNWKTAAAKLAA
jgi:hypothetical protein